MVPPLTPHPRSSSSAAPSSAESYQSSPGGAGQQRQETGIELRRDQTPLAPFSDESAPTLKELPQKLETIDRALAYLNEEGLRPSDAEGVPAAQRLSSPEFLGRAADAFRAVDIDGDGIPDKPRARVVVEDAGSAIKDAAAGAADAARSFFRRRRDGEDTPEENSPGRLPPRTTGTRSLDRPPPPTHATSSRRAGRR